MSRDERRDGDERPLHHDERVPLTFLPDSDQPFRWLPRHGEPSCVGEWVSQTAVKTVAFLPVYTALVVTLVLLVEVFGR